MNRLLLEGVVILVLGFSCYIMYQRWQDANERADKAEAALEVEKRNVKIVEKYVDRVVTIERNRPVVGAALERLCASAGLQRPGHPDAPAAPNADNGPTLQGLADDIIACQLNSEQLSGLQASIRAQ